MRNRTGVVILTLVCLGLFIALILIQNKAGKQIKTSTERIANLSNQWVETSASLDSQRQTNVLVESDLKKQIEAFDNLTNNFVQVSENLGKTEASLKTAQETIAKRDARIAELEAQNLALDQRSVDLTSAITNLTTQIADTQKKLEASEGDKQFLRKELQRMMVEKAELERQFNNLAVLKAQVSKLKEELSIARRLDWTRQGLTAATEQKGAQKLMKARPAIPNKQAPPAAVYRTNYDLNVEVSADGSLKIIPPPTNQPVTNPTP